MPSLSVGLRYIGRDAVAALHLGRVALTVHPEGSLEAITGAALVEVVEGQPGVGMAGTATPYYQAIPLAAPLTDRTIYAVVTVDPAATGNQTFIDASAGRTKVGFDGGNAWVAYANTQPAAANTGYAADKGTKRVIAAVFHAAGGYSLYRDGAQIATSAAAVSAVSGELRIGARAYNYEAWTGLIHHVRVHNTAHVDSTVVAASTWLLDHDTTPAA